MDQKYSSWDMKQLNTVSYSLLSSNMFCTLPWVVKYGIGILVKYGKYHIVIACNGQYSYKRKLNYSYASRKVVTLTHFDRIQ